MFCHKSMKMNSNTHYSEGFSEAGVWRREKCFEKSASTISTWRESWTQLENTSVPLWDLSIFEFQDEQRLPSNHISIFSDFKNGNPVRGLVNSVRGGTAEPYKAHQDSKGCLSLYEGIMGDTIYSHQYLLLHAVDRNNLGKLTTIARSV